VYTVNPGSLEIERVFEFRDHLGALVCDEARRGLVGVSWGSRRFYRWDLREVGTAPVQAMAPVQWDNASHYVDYQDGQFLKGTPWALFGGISRLVVDETATWTLGGLELVDVWEQRTVHQLPVALLAGRAESLLRNPFAVALRGTGMRFYFVPEDNTSTLQVYDVE
jgi:hypothetical protein